MKSRTIGTILLCLGLLGGCNNNSSNSIEESTTMEETAAESIEETKTLEFDASKPALTVGYNGNIDSLNPFFADTYDSRMITGMTQTNLLTTDRNGDIVYDAIDGENIVYKGIEYAYEGAADIEVDWDEELNQTTYTITLRSDLRFSDGKIVDADDLIFTLYVLSDPSYDGPYMVYSMPIVGMKSYRSNAPSNIAVTEEEIVQVLEEMPQALSRSIVNDIVQVQLTEEMEWCKAIFENSEYELLTEQYASYLEMFSYFYVREDMPIEDIAIEDVSLETEAALLQAVIAQYATDYKALGMACYNDETAFQGDAEKLAESWIIEQKISQGLIGNAPNISGIQKVNSNQITITTEGYDATAIYQLNIPIMALHYYGEMEQYDYENNQFGFVKEDLSHIYSMSEVPMGAGAYRFVSMEDGTISMISMMANEFYYKGEPETTQLQFLTVKEDEKISAVASGLVDVVRIMGSVENMEAIMSWNSNDSLTGDVLFTDMVDELAYSYIGIQAQNVCVAGEANSEESRYLRRGLATLFSYYREQAVEAYFGATANVIDYPMSQTLWASPKKSDSDYEMAFSRDIYQNLIYLEDMTEEESLEAMKKAVLEYFQKAGYEITDGVVTKAPEGAALEYEVILAQEKGAIHPCADLINQAAETLKEMGITLTIVYLENEAELSSRLKVGNQQIWCGESDAMIYPDLYEQYYSANCPGMGGTNENYFNIMDDELDFLILKARQDDDRNARKILYKQSLDLIMDWAVELPVYQSTENVLFNAKRVTINTVAEDITSYYSWLREIENISLQLEEGEEPTSSASQEENNEN